MNRSDVLRRQAFFWGLTLGIWALVVLAFTGQLMLARSLNWAQAARVALIEWLPWAILAPAIAWLSIQFPLELRKLPISLPVHLAACVAAALLFEVISRQIGLPPSPPPDDAMPRFQGPGGAGRRPFGPGPGPNGGAGQADDFRGGDRDGDFLPPDRPPFRRDQGPLGPGQGTNSAFRPYDRGRPDFPDRPPRPDGPDFQRGPPNFGPNGQPLPPGNREPPTLFRSAVLKARSNIPIYWVIVSIVHALTYYRRSQDRERKAIELEARLTDAKLEALRMQLQPHFLFNTLNAISTLVHRDPRAADEMIANLSELLRATLDTTDPEIPLRQELEFLDRYLEIQQVRFGERLRIEKKIDATALDALVPTLILQPLVENAVHHGIEPQITPGLVRIVAGREGDSLRLTVHDNGVPGVRPSSGAASHDRSEAAVGSRDSPLADIAAPADGRTPPPKSREGIGLPNTRARLQEMYGNRGRLTLTSASAGGFTVDLEIPFHEKAR